ncbi:MAG: hypothetical protein QM483_00505 [Desulfuromusa sp.]
MKNLLLIFLITLLATPCLALTDSLGSEYDNIVTFFQGEDEPEAKDAVWDSKLLLKIGVFDNGKKYDEYAKHVCQIVRDKGIQDKDVAVQIIDIKKLAHLKEWVVLGKAQCQ